MRGQQPLVVRSALRESACARIAWWFSPVRGRQCCTRTFSESCTRARNRSSARRTPVSPHSSMVRSRSSHVNAHGALGMSTPGLAPAPALQQHRIRGQAALELRSRASKPGIGPPPCDMPAAPELLDLLGGPACIAAAEHHPHVPLAVGGLEVRAILVHPGPVVHEHEVQVGRTRVPGALAPALGGAVSSISAAVPAAVRRAGRSSALSACRQMRARNTGASSRSRRRRGHAGRRRTADHEDRQDDQHYRERGHGSSVRNERAGRHLDDRPVMKNRRRPTLPGPCGPSTIGAEGLNCSVRNGKRCIPLASATEMAALTTAPARTGSRRAFKTAQLATGYHVRLDQEGRK